MTGQTTITAKALEEKTGMTKRSILRRAEKEGWPYRNGGNRTKRFVISSLPPDVQARVLAESGLSFDLLPSLRPGAAVTTMERLPAELAAPITRTTREVWGEGGIGMDVIRDDRVQKITKVLAEVDSLPQGWTQGRRKWIESVALRHGVKFQTIYKWIKKYEKGGLGALKHKKVTRGEARSWDPEALDYWIGLCLKKEHRKISRRALYYNALAVEAHRRGWKIGDLRSAYWWFDQRVTPQLLALQRGGMLALDNTLPPILRDYSDLPPFGILVGDQHRFDFWVVDDETGEVFRPEGYFWQDLRTRALYGGAVDRRYDSLLMGLALRIGMKIFGAFGSIYTDHGRPEESRYIMGVIKDIRAQGMEFHQTVDAPVDLEGFPAEEINPLLSLPPHRKAIVKNAKAKMIEGTFNVLEGILRNQFMVPGNAKRLAASGEEQEIDQKEIEALVRAGKLLTYSEFLATVFKAMDYYNREKPHRGVLREWTWKPKPKSVGPIDCLLACHQDGWRPRYLTDEAVDLIFLPQAKRIVDRGRISYKGKRFEHRALDPLHKQKVEIRYDPMDPTWVLVFYRGQYLCLAEPVEYSSMIDMDLAGRKIREKARMRKEWSALYRELTSPVKDFRQYSRVAPVEKAAALIGVDKRARAAEAEERNRPMSDEEVAVGLARIENYRPEITRPLFSSDRDRYQWLLERLAEGVVLEPKDMEFMLKFEVGMNEDTRKYWDVYRDSLGLDNAACGASIGGA